MAEQSPNAPLVGGLLALGAGIFSGILKLVNLRKASRKDAETETVGMATIQIGAVQNLLKLYKDERDEAVKRLEEREAEIDSLKDTIERTGTRHAAEMETLRGQMLPRGAILLIEDDSSHVDLIRRMLFRAHIGNQLVVAADAEAALGYLRNQGNSNFVLLILLDMGLPKMNGTQFLSEIRGEFSLKGLPVIVISGAGPSPDCDPSDLAALGVIAYMVKPVDEKQFTETIDKMGFYWTISGKNPAGSTLMIR